MKRSTLFPLAILSLGLFVFSPGCGTDVGNAGKPITSESSELAAVAGMQHDEVISSVNDGSDSDATAAMALFSPGKDSQLTDVSMTCTANADGSVAVKSSKTLALETEFGRPSKRKVQKDSLDTNLDMTYAVPSTLGVLSCNNNRPVLSWAQLAELKTLARLDKSRKRSVSLKEDGSIISQSELTVSSERSVQYAKVSASLESLTVRRTSTVNSTVSLLRQNKDETLTRSVKTLDAEPIVLEKTRTRGAGVTRVEIVSGAVASTSQDATMVVLRYKNLLLSLGSSCHPSSGSIEGQVFASSTAVEAESSFTVVFDSDGATLIHDDGTEEDMELESCQF
jgi:hypothetical protein